MSYFDDLKADVLAAYERGVSIPEAEKLAAKFLDAQLEVSDKLKISDLDARMKKNGYKTMRAKIYLDEIHKAEKKPTEAQLDATITTSEDVCILQDAYEEAEVERETLERLFSIYRDAHIYFRAIGRGKFE